MGTTIPQADLHDRLQTRRPEIEEAILTRVYGVSDPTEAGDLAYMEGLRAAVAAAIDYGLDSIASSERNQPQVPPEVLVQARIAARNKVSLDTVLRRYFAGYALLGDFLIEEAEREELQAEELKRLLRVQASIFDRLLVAVSEEYAREDEDRLGGAEQRRAELVERLLAGERIDTSELSYDLEAHHLGVIAKGPGAAEALRDLARRLDRRLLLLCREEGAAWAWLGGRRALEIADLKRLAPLACPSEVSLALGEPGRGLRGWRLTHRQAKAALPIALRGSEPIVRYSDVALIASILQDDLLTTSLRQIYLEPLEEERDGGKMALETLRAYFGAGRNAASAAAGLQITRQTVNNRLHAIEERIGRSRNHCASEMEAALRLSELDESLTPRPRPAPLP